MSFPAKHYSKRGKVASATDSWLDNMGYYRKNVAYDETCLFRAVSEQMFYTQIYHERVRKECIQYAKENYTKFLHFFGGDVNSLFDHLEKLGNHMVICGSIELEIISWKYNRDVILFDAVMQTKQNITSRNLPEVLLMCRVTDDHFDVIYKCDHIVTAGFCQSIVYKILFENIFGTPDVDNVVNLMLYEKPPNLLNSHEYLATMNKYPNVSDDCDSSDKSNERLELISNENTFIPPFPFKIAKALDPNIYRNIEYDTWTEIRREMRLGEWYYGDNNLTLGTSCILNTDDGSLKCYIQEFSKDDEKCVVYITELAERRTVKYSDLSPEDDAKPWPLPYRFSKNLILNSTTTVLQTDKDKRSPRKRKEKKRPKSLNLSVIQPVASLTGLENNIGAFEGCPLQMQPAASAVQEVACPKAVTADTPEAVKVEEQNLQSQKIEKYPYTVEPIPWSVLPTTPESGYWPQSPVLTSNMFAFNNPVIPNSTSPTSPEIIPFLQDNGVHYYYNIPEEYNNNYQLWSDNNNEINETKQDPNCNESSQSEISSNSEVNNNCLPASYAGPGDFYNQPQYSVPPIDNNIHNVTTTALNTPIYPSPIYQIPHATPVFYSPSEAPQPSPIPMYTSPMFTPPIFPSADVQFVPSAPFVYSPASPVAWYPPPINAQGFIFPPMNAQNAANI